MSKKIILSIVIILGILIILAFSGLVYGMYSKISISQKSISNLSINLSEYMIDNEKVKNIKVINDEKLLILIENKGELKGLVYDVNKNQIIRIIKP